MSERKPMTLEEMLRAELPAPVAQGLTVLAAMPTTPRAPLVRRAVEIRTEIGVERYGVPLHVDDGRPEADAGQEAGDLANYLLRSAARGDATALALLDKGQDWLADVLAWSCGWLDGEIDVMLPCLDPSSGDCVGKVERVCFDGDYTLAGAPLSIGLTTADWAFVRIDGVVYRHKGMARQTPTLVFLTVRMSLLWARRLMRALLVRVWKVEDALVGDERFEDLLGDPRWSTRGGA